MVDQSGNVGQFSSLKLNGRGIPCIAYYDATNKRLKFADIEGANSAWQSCVVDSDGDVGTDCSLAVDNGGYWHISYRDVLNRNVKYVTSKPSSPPLPPKWP